MVDRFPVNAEDAADTHRIQSPVVDQPPDRLRVHAELIRNLANTDESRFFAWCRHGRGPKPCTFFGHAYQPSELGVEGWRATAQGVPPATRRWARFAPNDSS
jgi:hypothetical protein